MKIKYIFYPFIYPITLVSGGLSFVFINLAWWCACFGDWLNDKVLKTENYG